MGVNKKIPGLDAQVIGLKRWMKENGWKNETRLALKDFPTTGRGVCSYHSLNIGDTIIEIPYRLMITADVVTRSDWISFLTAPLEIHELLALFLIYERHKGPDSAWSSYISSLPSDLPELSWLSSEICSQKKRKQVFEKSLERVRKSMGAMELADRVFTTNSFTWGYVMVNTRAVHVDPDIVTEHPILLDNPNMALCPYLDMFNHSDSADTRAILDKSTGTYKLVTLTPYKKHRQIFISYGSHENEKLLMEYGFFIPGNKLDAIKLDFETIKREIKMDARQYKYVKEKLFDRDLTVSLEGPSFNLKALLYVALRNNGERDWNATIFTASYSELETKEMLSMCLIWLKEPHREEFIEGGNCTAIDYLKYLRKFRQTLIEHLLQEIG